jgi:hypothetical protein
MLQYLLLKVEMIMDGMIMRVMNQIHLDFHNLELVARHCMLRFNRYLESSLNCEIWRFR